MSEIPYYFETPIPKYFREAGWFNNPNTVLFVTWAFSKCSTQAHTVIHDRKEIKLAPYEFITGRGKSAAACLLSEDAFKHQLNTMLNAGFLKKTHNSTPNRFTCYVWVTERFSKVNTQLNTQLNANWTPTERPQSRKEKIRSKESHHPDPSSLDLPKADDDGLTDFSSKRKKNGKQHNIDYETVKPIEIYPNIFLKPKELEECIAIKGSIEAVKIAIESIERTPGRKYKIRDWPNTLAVWEVKPSFKPRIIENEEMAKRLENQFGSCFGWRCQTYFDRKKDQKGILFLNGTSTGSSEPIFIAYSDAEFKEKVNKVLRDKRMQKGRISPS